MHFNLIENPPVKHFHADVQRITMFEINGKIALVTGGASGIGLRYSKELLRNGAKAVTLADVNPEFGAKALEEIQQEFGPNRAIFVKTDVTKQEEFERAFEATVDKFKYIDILFNNAGIFNDITWEKEIAVNVTASVRGCILAIEKYLPKHKQGPEGLVVNISSIAGTDHLQGCIPVYTTTKHAIIGLTKSWGYPGLYELTKVRVVAICPGVTLTPLVANTKGNSRGGHCGKMLDEWLPTAPTQEPEFVAKEAMDVVKYAPTGTAWVIEGDEPAYQYETPDRATMKKNVLRK